MLHFFTARAPNPAFVRGKMNGELPIPSRTWVARLTEAASETFLSGMSNSMQAVSTPIALFQRGQSYYYPRDRARWIRVEYRVAMRMTYKQ